jgi:hypothetical protein
VRRARGLEARKGELPADALDDAAVVLAFDRRHLLGVSADEEAGHVRIEHIRGGERRIGQAEIGSDRTDVSRRLGAVAPERAGCRGALQPGEPSDTLRWARETNRRTAE